MKRFIDKIVDMKLEDVLESEECYKLYLKCSKRLDTEECRKRFKMTASILKIKQNSDNGGA